MSEFSSNPLEDAKGKTITSVEGLEKGSEQVEIHFDDKSYLVFLHHQDCCEHVELYDFELTARSVEKLIGGVINDARCDTDDAAAEDVECRDDSGTWTFYNINTSKGCINMRWLGTSNGYYSEGVSVSLYKK